MDKILEISNINKKFGDHTALNNVSLTIPKGTIFGLLGPNGAGKTTLIRIITRISAADSGEVLYKGEKLNTDHARRMGYLPEERGLYKKMTVADQLKYLAGLRGLSAKEAKQKLIPWVERLDLKPWLNKKVEDLSKGMQQKVQFIATVIHEPDLLILDEPFSGFDPINANLIKDEILKMRDAGTSVIFSTHRMESVEELCDHLALINHSEKVLDGQTSEIRDRFKENIFLFETKDALTDWPAEVNLLSEEKNKKGHVVSRLQIEGIVPNDLILFVINRTELKSFREVIPSINDIFIKLASKN